MLENRRYAFDWGLIGDIDTGRPNLGHTTRLEVYRLMQFTFRDVLERRLGAAETDRVFYEAGQLAGREFYRNVIGESASFEDFIRKLEENLQGLSMGILRFEQADPQAGRYTITLAEDLDCSGLPELDFEVCTYDEGFLSGVLESYSGAPFHVKEVDCWCTGDRTCRFTAERVKE